MSVNSDQPQEQDPNASQPDRVMTYVSPEDGFLKRKVVKLVEHLAGFTKLAPMYREMLEQNLEGTEVFQASVDKLGLNLNLHHEERLENVPATGPLVLIANHPFGVVDGLILSMLASRLRDKFHILVHESLVHQDPRISDYLLPIDFRETKEAMATNLETRRQSIERLKAGEALAIFPAGGVATAKRGFGAVQEFEWKRFVTSVIHKSRATVVPFYFHGRNSRLFHLVSQISPVLRTGLLLHEVKNKIGETIEVEVGQPLPYAELAEFKDRQQLLDHLYRVTMDLRRGS